VEHILVTGGAGFIGSHFVRYMLEKYPGYAIHVLDKLTYAGNLANLADVQERYGPSQRYRFFQGDICDATIVATAMQGCKYVLNFAAESHVDRSLEYPGHFIMTDVYGTHILLEQAKKVGVERFVQISTDEIYGEVLSGDAREDAHVAPRSPYSASKAGGEFIAHAYFITYGLPVVITRGSNTFGPFQYPEKLIPLFITNALEDRFLPVYGDGLQVRDWIYVLDHCRGIDIVLHQGNVGETYNIGGGNEYQNIAITRLILALLDKPSSLIRSVPDRPGHDRRYALNTNKIRQLGWQPLYGFEEAITQTLTWYTQHEEWWKPLKDAAFLPAFLQQA
jgi:dTDP-glucose 4,6-dehydratase